MNNPNRIACGSIRHVERELSLQAIGVCQISNAQTQRDMSELKRNLAHSMRFRLRA